MPVQFMVMQGMFIAPIIASVAVVSGGIPSIIATSIQPLAATSTIALLATAVGVFAGQVFRWCNFAKNGGEQLVIAFASVQLVYIGLFIAGMVSGYIPVGGYMGVAALIASLLVSVLIIVPYIQCIKNYIRI